MTHEQQSWWEHIKAVLQSPPQNTEEIKDAHTWETEMPGTDKTRRQRSRGQTGLADRDPGTDRTRRQRFWGQTGLGGRDARVGECTHLSITCILILELTMIPPPVSG